ncbi:MAG: hypothetical protein UU23_C0001G0133 [Candidatus Curtissbacteria bacterium GW2011_GWA1_40_9]|uniref:Uncharacterized protein n=1 Tax=Candidatus Curtissbacteria bacterium GW2011_GWA1_40_9 TaxID=1618408 RepID=A0A0G0TMU9_9BACT|nr:MAG: hypothetical protein UU23_C0001G0133 [Candidatus Curtissbacteria bacterium GW2011_GWA1_40_9]
MEGGRSFEAYRPRTETPEQLFRGELRREINRALESADNPLAIEIAEKALEKLDIKDRVGEMSRYKDDPTVYQDWKQLGLFMVIDKISRINYQDPNSGIRIRKGDRVLDLHLPPVAKEDRTLANVTRSMELIAQYIAIHDLDVKYLVGVTTERLAMISKRQGFTIVEPEIPEDIKRGVENVYRRFGDRGINAEAMGRILLCYQETEQFMQRFSKKS